MFARVQFLTATLSVVLGSLASTTSPSLAHDAPKGWSYPYNCCSGYDCREVKQTSISERADGYHVPSGEVVAYTDTRIKESPDGEYHWCSIAGANDGRTICLFVPPKSF